MKSREELKLDSKKAMKDKLLISFIVSLIPSMIAGFPSVILSGIENSSGGVEVAFSFALTLFGILVMPMQTGKALYFLNLYRGKNENFNNLFEMYKGSAGEIIKAKLLSGLYIIIGCIFFIIPGIYLALKYSMIDYIFADKKDIKFRDAMQESGEIMKGNKGRLIVLAFSFILWFFAIVFTFGIAIIYVAPYIETTIAGFYNDIRKPLPQLDEPSQDFEKDDNKKIFQDF